MGYLLRVIIFYLLVVGWDVIENYVSLRNIVWSFYDIVECHSRRLIENNWSKLLYRILTKAVCIELKNKNQDIKWVSKKK
jgi:hypothetical protein